MTKIPKLLLISAVAGLPLVLVSASLATTPGLGAIGFPLAYRTANPPTCGTLNPLNGCGYSDNLVSLGLDYLFWLLIALAFLTIIQSSWVNTIVLRN